MKKQTILFGIIALLFGGFVFAQAANLGDSSIEKEKKDRVEERATKLTEKLGLSADQKAAVVDLNRQIEPKMKALHEEMKRLRAEKKALHKSVDDQVLLILSDEQKEKFLLMKAERKERMESRKGRKGHKGKKGPRGGKGAKCAPETK